MYRLVIDCQQQPEGAIHLTPEQCHYLQRVLRLQDGDHFVAMNGQGQAWIAQLRGTSAQIGKLLLESRELPLEVTLMVALPKGNGFEDILRCCTELGVKTIMPMMSERTLLKPSSHKVERWRKIAIEATEQSERQIVPTILEPVSFSTALIKVKELGKKHYICVTRREANHLLTTLLPRIPESLVIATGPEGGWTSQEVEMAIAHEFETVSLGCRILRAITAPIVALSLIAAVVEQNLNQS